MKVKNKLQLAVFFMSMLILPVCSAHELNPTPQQAGLIGTWAIKCAKSKDVPGYHYNKGLRFVDNTLYTDFFYYKDHNSAVNKCTLATLGFASEFETSIALGKTTSPGSKDEHTDINITTTNVQIVPMDKAYVAMFNDPSWHAGVYSGFGKTDWAKGDLKDVSKLPQAIKDFHIGSSVPDIFQISKITNDLRILKMGDKQGSLDPDGRPLMLDKIYATFARKLMPLQNSSTVLIYK